MSILLTHNAQGIRGQLRNHSMKSRKSCSSGRSSRTLGDSQVTNLAFAENHRMDDSSNSPARASDTKLPWPKLSLVVSGLLSLMAWEVIVWFVPAQPRAVLKTSDRLMGFSPDGQTLVTGLQPHGFLTGQIRLWSANCGEKLEVVGEAGTILLPNVVYLSQRDLISESGIIADIDPRLYRSITLVLYDLQARRKTGSIRLDFSDLSNSHGLCFAPNGRTLAICTTRQADDSGDLRLVDVATGQVRAHLNGKGFGGSVFSPDGSTLAISQSQPRMDDKNLDDEAIVLLDAATGQIQKKLELDGSRLFPLGFSPDGQKLATNCFPKHEVNIWNLSNQDMRSFNAEIFAAFLPDGKGLAKADEDLHTITFTDVFTGKDFVVVENPFSYHWCSTYFLPIPGTHLLAIPTTHDVRPIPFLQRWGTWLGIKGLGSERNDQELAFLDTGTGKKVAAIVREGMGDPRISIDGRSLAFSSFDEDEKFIEIWDIPP